MQCLEAYVTLTFSQSQMTHSFRHGNCLWKRKFPRQWNWLSAEKRNCLRGKKLGGYQNKTTAKKTGAPILVLHQIPWKKWSWSRSVIAHYCRLIVNTGAAVTLASSHSYAFLRHVSAEEKRMFRKFSKWKNHHVGCMAKSSTTAAVPINMSWISVNVSRISLVGQRREKPLGHSNSVRFSCVA